ncbi:MAG TPA: hypothetical protein VGB70_13540 [Allosphingosinicella sp.]
MRVLFLLAALTACSPAAPENSTAATERDGVQDPRHLRSGYFRIVPPDERPERIAHVQQGLRALGVPATVQSCDWMGVIANGNASGAYAFGGICKVAIADKPAETFLVCHDRIGGTSLAKPGNVGISDGEGELLLRRICV